MTIDLTIRKTINIKSNKSKVWDALTNPKLVTQYLFGATVKSEWIVGSKIVYEGSFNGINFKDVGFINCLDFEKEFKYSYWSANHGTENIPENYVTVSYFITEDNTETKLDITQTNYKSKEIAEATNQIWEIILNNLKTLVEKNK